MKKIGILLLVIGLLVSVFSGFNFFTRKKVMDIGTIEIVQNQKHHLGWTPVLGLVLIVTGGAIYLFGAKGKNSIG